MLVLREAMLGECTFEAFQRNLQIPRTTLADRLRRLTEAGLLDAIDRGKRGTRFEYELTAKGQELLPVLVGLTQWGDRWVSGKGHEPALLSNSRTNAPLAPVRIVDTEGALVSLDTLAIRPGPGADSLTKARFRRGRVFRFRPS
jgi:DNA-binding HxlR family transcriptional regulator